MHFRNYKENLIRTYLWLLLSSFLSFIINSCAHTPSMNHINSNLNELRKTAKIDGLRVSYLEKGEGDNVILIHGFGVTNYVWRKNIDDLSRHFTVYAIDMIGSGYTEKPLNFNYSINNMSKFIYEFMKRLKLDNVFLVGHSLGGAVCLNLTLNHPENISKLVLIDSLGHHQDLPFTIKILRNRILNKLVPIFSGKWSIKLILKKAYFNDSLLTDEEVNEYSKALESLNGKKVLQKMFMETFDEEYAKDLQKHFNKIDKETLVIWGEKDEIIAPLYGTLFSREIKNSKLVLIKNVGHVPHLEDPSTVNKMIVEFFEGVKNN